MRSSACSKAGQGFENAGQQRHGEPVFGEKIWPDEDHLKAEEARGFPLRTQRWVGGLEAQFTSDAEAG